MTAFIRQEALEKANEINLKADEEFAIEKSKLVRQETASIDTAYERKFKSAQMSQQIAKSNVNNKTRLKVLSAKQELLDGLFEKAGEQLKKTAKDKAKYSTLLANLILEGAYALDEKAVLVRAREADYDLIKKAFEGVKKDYKKATNKEVELKLDEKSPLPAGSYV
jgi:V-type H+-transporting ATPase subunit E